MSSNDRNPTEERQQTDESLREERKDSDQASEEELAAIDETADAVIIRARERADEVLAAARAKTDRKASDTMPPSGGPHLQTTASLERERVLEDRNLEKERVDADAILRAERAEHVALLSSRRKETDKDLLIERERADTELATRDEFLGIVSHDLREQLHGMVLLARVIAEGAATEDHVPMVIENARRIQRAGSRMSRLIGDLVDIASIQAGVLAVTRELSSPADVVAEAVSTFKERASVGGVSLLTEVAQPSSQASFDPARILQVLINLLSNAMKFTPADGKIVVRVERTQDELSFAVSDTGAGIPKDSLEAVFERFAQVKRNDRRGVGLGLFISKCIVEGHGGRIWAESKLSEGSTFCFTLPLAD